MVDRLRTRIRLLARMRPDAWWSLVLLGVASVAVGVAMLVWPHAALRAVALLIGGWLVVAGAVRIVAALADRNRPRDRQRMSVAVGLACVAAGVVCLGDTTTTVRLLAFVLAAQWLVAGIGDILDGVRDQRPGRAWLVVLGVLSTVAGSVFLVWPMGSLVAFLVLAAGSTIGIGVMDVVAGLRLRRLRRG